MSHTPGPWIVLDLQNNGDECITIAASHTPQAVCRICNEVSDLPLNQEDLDNARLIAAAPEMLETLEAVRQMLLCWGCRDLPLVGYIESAIKKATGEA